MSDQLPDRKPPPLPPPALDYYTPTRPDRGSAAGSFMSGCFLGLLVLIMIPAMGGATAGGVAIGAAVLFIGILALFAGTRKPHPLAFFLGCLVPVGILMLLIGLCFNSFRDL